MIAESPRSRRKFAHERDEIDYLYGKLLYWFYEREDSRKARPFADRLERLLKRTAPHQEAIFAAECWSLIYELRGDPLKAIRHRENEVRSIKRLHEIAGKTSNRGFVLSRYGYSDLSDRLDLLAILYHDNGDLDRAIQTLQESRQLCQQHGIVFDGQDLLQEYLHDKRASRNGFQKRENT
jgi:DNA polymerase III delta prime subunit